MSLATAAEIHGVVWDLMPTIPDIVISNVKALAKMEGDSPIRDSNLVVEWQLKQLVDDDDYDDDYEPPDKQEENEDDDYNPSDYVEEDIDITEDTNDAVTPSCSSASPCS